MVLEPVQIGGTLCDRVIFVCGDDNGLVGIQLFKDSNVPVAFLPLDVQSARAALEEFEGRIKAAEAVKQQMNNKN